MLFYVPRVTVAELGPLPSTLLAYTVTTMLVVAGHDDDSSMLNVCLHVPLMHDGAKMLAVPHTLPNVESE